MEIGRSTVAAVEHAPSYYRRSEAVIAADSRGPSRPPLSSARAASLCHCISYLGSGGSQESQEVKKKVAVASPVTPAAWYLEGFKRTQSSRVGGGLVFQEN